MRKGCFGLLAVLCFVFVLNSCKDKSYFGNKGVNTQDSILVSSADVLPSFVMTKEEQAKLTPSEVLAILKEGNKDFVEDNLTIRNNTQRVRDAAIGQYPYAAVLSCMDSRVPVEDVFHCGIGDVFVARVAGNVVDKNMLGSLEYACKVSGTKLIVVLGHEYCGAIKSAIDDVKLGNITDLLAHIQPAVKEASVHFTGEKNSSNPDFVEAVCDENVELSRASIREGSPILKDMEDKGEIKIVGGVYDMKTGVVEFFE